MTKLITILALAASLTGCMYQSVNQSDIQAAAKACGGVESIQDIEAYALGNEYTHCMNRSYIRLETR